MTTKLVPVVDSRWKKKKKKNPTKHMSKRRKLRSALKRIFNYMKSDSYMFAPLIHPQSPLISSGEVLFKPIMEKEKKLVEDVNDYLKCDTYMYAPLATDSACDSTTSPPPVQNTETTEAHNEHSPAKCRTIASCSRKECFTKIGALYLPQEKCHHRGSHQL